MIVEQTAAALSVAGQSVAADSRRLLVRDLGLLPYDDAWALQRRVAADRIAQVIAQDVLLLVEHPPVVTLGRSTKAHHLLATPESLAAADVALRDVERGGDVTVHEPGQLVLYPIIDLKRHRRDLHWYLRQLEQAIIDGLGALGLDSGRVDGLTGVWRRTSDDTTTDGVATSHASHRKLASIGVHARDWVTWHGIALNVTNDLRTFEHVVPCGIDAVEMTSVAREFRDAGRAVPTMPVVKASIVRQLAAVFDLTPMEVPQSE